MILKYTYRTLITFSTQVSSHTFMLRCTPYANEYQRLIEHKTSVIPNCLLTRSNDTFGSILETGYVADMHDTFMFESTGIIEIGNNRSIEKVNPLFHYHSELTTPDVAIRDAARLIGMDMSVTEWVMRLSDYLQGHFQYESGATNVKTTASEAFSLGKGVCQDYAHIAIAMCREVGIAARYVNGFMIGEGATHAWIEYHDGERWLGFDPTNNRPVDDTYIKIAHGRDFNDCSINRGRFNGIAEQNIKVTLMVEQLKKLPKEQTKQIKNQ